MERTIVFSHAICSSGSCRGAHYFVHGRTGTTDQFGDFLFCTSHRLQHDELLYGQDGWRVHDHNLYDRDVHGVCTTMAGYSWLRLGDDSSLRQLLLELELRRIPIMGTSDERLHLFG